MKLNLLPGGRCGAAKARERAREAVAVARYSGTGVVARARGPGQSRPRRAPGARGQVDNTGG